MVSKRFYDTYIELVIKKPVSVRSGGLKTAGNGIQNVSYIV